MRFILLAAETVTSNPDMMKVMIWILAGVVAVLMPATGALIWRSNNRVVDKLDEVVEKIGSLSTELVRQDGNLAKLEQLVITNEKRLNDHTTRLRKIEKTQASCNNCTA